MFIYGEYSRRWQLEVFSFLPKLAKKKGLNKCQGKFVNLYDFHSPWFNTSYTVLIDSSIMSLVNVKIYNAEFNCTEIIKQGNSSFNR